MNNNKPPAAAVDANATWYDSMDEAVHAAYGSIGKDAKDSEYAGVIVQNKEGKFTASTPLASDMHDHFSLRAQIVDGQKLAGIYHTHLGDDANAKYFSSDDVHMADQLKLPSYIQTVSDGTVRRYTPGVTKTTTVPNGYSMSSNARISPGDVVPAPVPPKRNASIPTPVLASAAPGSAALSAH